MRFRKTMLSAFAALTWGFLAGSADAQPTPSGRPDFSGLWQCRTSCGNNTLLPYDQLGLTPEGQKLYAEKKAGVDRGDPKVDTPLQCHPVGMPRLAMFGTFEIFQKDDRIGIIGEWLGPARVIYFQNTHRKDYFPTFMGDSIGRWEGNTLVIDTVNVEEETFLDSSGFPHSDQFHMIERWTISPDGQAITSEWTLTDPKIFKNPFKKTVVYRKKNATDEKQRIVENVCLNVTSGGKLVE